MVGRSDKRIPLWILDFAMIGLCHVKGFCYKMRKNFIRFYSSLQKFCYQNENSKLISGEIATIFNDFLHWSGRTYKILPKNINEHNFLLLCVMFSFTHTFKTLVNILKNTVYNLIIAISILKLLVEAQR